MANNVEAGDRNAEPQEFRLINFPSGSPEPLPDHVNFIRGELKAKILTPQSRVELVGFASKLGFKTGGDTKAKNKALSDERVGRVKRLILQAQPGIDVKDSGVGDTGYQAGDQDDDGRFRAVSIKVFNGRRGEAPVVKDERICGPDVTEEIKQVWTKVQNDFHSWTFTQKFKVCYRLLIGLKAPDQPLQIPRDLEQLKQEAQKVFDINNFDTLPLFQGDSGWLRRKPLNFPGARCPCGSPRNPAAPDDNSFSDLHEDPKTCSNTVAVKGKCWLNGTVNYGTFGIMVQLCDEFSRSAPIQALRLIPGGGVAVDVIQGAFSLSWAEFMLKAYKTARNQTDDIAKTIAWTEATFRNGPSGTPDIPGDRPTCQCKCKCKGSIVVWDYAWEPVKKRSDATHPVLVANAPEDCC